MGSAKTKFKKIDDNNLQEFDKDGKTSAKWTSGFERVNLSLGNIKIHSVFSINYIERIGYASKRIGKEPSPKGTVFSYIKPDPKFSRRITAECVDSNDVFYRLVKESEKTDEYECQQLPNSIEITLEECEDEPHKSKDYPKGVFYGFLWIDEDRDNTGKPPSLNIVCHVPVSQMDRLLQEINKGYLSSVSLGLKVFSFRNEMDKNFSEFSMTQYLLIEEGAEASISSIMVSIEPTVQACSPAGKEDSDNSLGTIRSFFASNHLGIEKLFVRIVHVLWIIAALLLLQLFK